jgi:hypothetical protein
MANEERNLKPYQTDKRTPEERKEIARKGAEATNRLKKQRKTLREELLALLAEGDRQSKISLALLDKARKGDTKAYEVIRDTIGEKQADKLETDNKIEVNIKVIDSGT